MTRSSRRVIVAAIATASIVARVSSRFAPRLHVCPQEYRREACEKETGERGPARSDGITCLFNRDKEQRARSSKVARLNFGEDLKHDLDSGTSSKIEEAVGGMRYVV